VRERVHFFGLRWDGERSACERKVTCHGLVSEERLCA
jgi:hypothetical protein